MLILWKPGGGGADGGGWSVVLVVAAAATVVAVVEGSEPAILKSLSLDLSAVHSYGLRRTRC